MGSDVAEEDSYLGGGHLYPGSPIGRIIPPLTSEMMSNCLVGTHSAKVASGANMRSQQGYFLLNLFLSYYLYLILL